MKYFFTSPSIEKDFPLKNYKFKNHLVSYIEGANRLNKFREESSVIVDSGAFSAWNSGKVIDIDKYKEFCLKMPESWTFVNLDVIPETGSTKKEIEICANKSYENYLYLSKSIKKVLPVHHFGESLEWLYKYQSLTNYIGISPANDTMEDVKREYLKEVYKDWTPEFKYHGFGYSAFEGLFLFPFYTVDSIRWKRYVFLNKKRMHMFTSSQFRCLRFESVRKWLYIEQQVTDSWKKRGVFWDE